MEMFDTGNGEAGWVYNGQKFANEHGIHVGGNGKQDRLMNIYRIYKDPTPPPTRKQLKNVPIVGVY